MINFFLCDDNKSFLDNINKIVNNFMMKNDIDFKVHLFESINDSIKNCSKEIKGFKVFILDIETKEESGIEFSRFIREDLNDWNSIIILITAHNELKYEVLSKRLFIFDFINKFDSYKNILINDLDNVIKHYENREKKFSYKEKRIVKFINYNEIILLEKEKITDKVKIITNDKYIYIKEGLSNILKRLDKRFVRINRSIIINKDKVIEHDLERNTISLENDILVYDLAKNFRKNKNNE